MKRYIATTTLHFAPLFIAVLMVFAPQGMALADGGRLYLSQSDGTYTVGKPFTVKVLADTSGVAVNAIEGEIAYNPLDVSVESISTDHSILSLFSTQPSYNGAAGTISFSGWTQDTYKGSAGLLLTLTLVPLRAGQITLNFNSGAMLAANGKGSNIITAMVSGTYASQPKQIAAPAPQATASSTPATPENPQQVTAGVDTTQGTSPSTAGESNAAALPLSGAGTSTLAAVLLYVTASELLQYIGFFGILTLIAFAVAYYFHRKKIAF